MKIWVVLSEEPYNATTSVLSAHATKGGAESVVQKMKDSDEIKFKHEPSPSYNIEEVELETEEVK